MREKEDHQWPACGTDETSFRNNLRRRFIPASFQSTFAGFTFRFIAMFTAITEKDKRRSRISVMRKIGGKLRVFIASSFCSSVLTRYLRFPWKSILPKKYLQQLYLKWTERRRKAVARCNIEPNLVVILFCRISCPMTKQYWTLAKITPHTK